MFRYIVAYGAALAITERLAAQDSSNPEGQRNLVVSLFKLAQAAGASGDQQTAAAELAQCHAVLRRMHDRGMHLDPAAARVLEQLDQAEAGRAPSTPSAGPALPSGAAGVPLPHPGADPKRAAQLNAEYQHQLATWQALPLWKRWRTKKPEPPEGI